MKIHFCYILLLSILLGSCQNTPSAPDQNEVPDYSVETIKVFKQFYTLGEDTPFLDEYGRVNRYIGKDSLFLEYCKDSTISINKQTGLPVSKVKEFCYPQKDLFVNGEFYINPEAYPSGQAFRRNVLKSITDYNINNTLYTVYRMFSVTSQDQEGQRILVSSNEYWNDQLGLLFKVDENFAVKKRRVIQLERASTLNDEPILVKELIQKIQNDSSDWLTRKADGELWF